MTSRIGQTLTLALLGVLTLAAGGCHRPSLGFLGFDASIDKHVFRSNIYHPVTITLYNNVTREKIWKIDVPTYHDLVIDFQNTTGDVPLIYADEMTPATSMKWKLIPWDESPVRKGEILLPGTPVHYEYSHREGPEMPPTDPEAYYDQMITVYIDYSEVATVTLDDSIDTDYGIEPAAEQEMDADAEAESEAAGEAADAVEEAAEEIEEDAAEADPALTPDEPGE